MMLGHYPHYKASMSRLISTHHDASITKLTLESQIFNDIQTFQSDIKKVVMKHICHGYDLFPPTNSKADDDNGLVVVMNKADQLLCISAYLHGEPDELVCKYFKYQYLSSYKTG